MASSSSRASNPRERADRTLSDVYRHVVDRDHPTSLYLGEETIIGGPENEAAVEIIFRCVRGRTTESRHALVSMRPSVPEDTLALRLCHIFDIPTTGDVTLEPVVKWLPGILAKEEWTETTLPFAELAKIIHATMSGIVDLNVIVCGEESGGCARCQHKAVLDLIAMRNARTWDIGYSTLCIACAHRMWLAPADFPEAGFGDGLVPIDPDNLSVWDFSI